MEDRQYENYVQKAQAGDAESFSTLYESYKNRLYYFSLKNVKNPEDAEEIVQETFIEAFKSIGGLKDSEMFRSWLYTICYRQCMKHFKKQGHSIAQEPETYESFENELYDEDNSVLPEESLALEETKRAVMELIDNLPESQKATILMYYYEELPIKDIADIQQCPENTVKGRLLYARRAIKNEIEVATKKGKPIIVFAPFAFLVALFKEDAFANPLPAEASSTIWGNVTASAAKSTSSMTGAATKAATKAGMSIGTKITAGVIGVTVVTSVAVTAVTMSQPKSIVPESIPVVESVETQKLPKSVVPMDTHDIEIAEPVTWSDYAKIYYNYLSTYIIPSEGTADITDNEFSKTGFLDCEMIDIDNDSVPELITLGIIYDEFDAESDAEFTFFKYTGDEGEKEIKRFSGHRTNCLYPNWEGGFHDFFLSSYNGITSIILMSECSVCDNEYSNISITPIFVDPYDESREYFSLGSTHSMRLGWSNGGGSNGEVSETHKEFSFWISKLNMPPEINAITREDFYARADAIKENSRELGISFEAKKSDMSYRYTYGERLKEYFK